MDERRKEYIDRINNVAADVYMLEDNIGVYLESTIGTSWCSICQMVKADGNISNFCSLCPQYMGTVDVFDGCPASKYKALI